MIQNPRNTLTSHRSIGLFASICIIGLGLLCASCQPVLPKAEFHSPEEKQPRKESLQERPGNAGALPVPEISWGEPPLCPGEEQDQGQNQQAVCARLRYRADAELRELIWSEAGIVRDTQALTDVPPGVTSFSPDGSRLVIQTPRGHTAGGPIYLYDLGTEQLVNLNEQVGLPVYTGVSALRVAGWHPDGQQLLLVNEDDELTFWLDLESGRYRPLALDIDVGQLAPPRRFALAPDGSGFTFDSYNRDATTRDTEAAYLYWYDLATDETRLLLTVPSGQGQLAESAISPDGEQLAYLVHRGGRAQGRSEEVHLIEFNQGLTEDRTDTAIVDSADSRLLLAGNLGPTRPVWSPDGEYIALIRRDMDEPLRAARNQPPPLGDIWIIDTISGETTQLTFTQALEQPPVWSPDGRYLAFVTADGQIGMVAVDAPGKIWQLDDTSLSPEIVQIAFAPSELAK